MSSAPMSGPDPAVDPASLTLHPFIRDLVDRLLAASPLAACLLAGERDGPRLAGQVRAFPSTDMASFDTSAHRRYGRGLFLSLELLAFFRDCYLSDSAQALDPLVSPLRAPNLSHQPPTRLSLAEHDLLRDEALALARRLQEAGVPCETTVQTGMIHGFFGMHGISPEENGLAEAAAFLRRVLRVETP